MRIKLTGDQLLAVSNLLNCLIEVNPSENLAEEIVEELVNKMFIKLQSKIFQLSNKGIWTITITDLEAKAFWLFFQRAMCPNPSRYEYELLQLQTIFNLIDKTYGGTRTENTTNGRLVAGTSPRRLGS